MVAIEESSDLTAVKIEELQSSLEAHEQRVLDRNKQRATEQAMLAQIAKKGGNGKLK